MPKLHVEMRSELRFLAFFLANGTIDHDVLPVGTDYSALFTEASAFEQAFAVWANVLEVDERGRPLNGHVAKRRMAQYIRGFMDPSYVVEPPFEEWELELHV